MLPGFEKFKNGREDKNNAFSRVYDEVEYKLSTGQEPNLQDLRRWFIEGTERHYNTKLLGTNAIHCYKTFNKLKDKYGICNYELCKKIIHWRTEFDKLGYNRMFDISAMNTDWIMDKLENKGSRTKRTTYLSDNTNNIDTSNRRI